MSKGLKIKIKWGKRFRDMGEKELRYELRYNQFMLIFVPSAIFFVMFWEYNVIGVWSNLERVFFGITILVIIFLETWLISRIKRLLKERGTSFG